VQNEHPKFAGGANEVCLEEAQRNVIECGACQPDLVSRTRPPATGEFPPPEVFTGTPNERRLRARIHFERQILVAIRMALSGATSMLGASFLIAPLARNLDDVQVEEWLDAFVRIAQEASGFDPRDPALQKYEESLAEPMQSHCRDFEPFLKERLAGLMSRSMTPNYPMR
jgi:hypothetical protein